MDRAPETKHLTLMLMTDETSPMRRYQVAHRLLKRLGIAMGLVILLLAVGLVDYVRLRLQAVDVARLSAETVAQRDQVEKVTASLEALEEELARLHEFERKVRVIANLPSSMAHTVGDPQSAAAHQGGGLEAADAASGSSGEPTPPAGPLAEPADEALPPQAWMSQNHLHPGALARVTRKAERLGPVAALRSASFDELLEGLDGKSRQLASMPSIWPAQGWLTSRFGYRISPFTGKRQFHAGLDIASDIGTDVVAPARGKVVKTGRQGHLGKRLVIDHGYGVRTVYGHLQDMHVRVGQEVERGQRIATVGTSGRSTGPHLHYSVELNGKSTDPLDYVLE